MELSEEQKQVYIETAKALKGSARRVFMARIAKLVGSQRRAARELGWERETISKGMRAVESGEGGRKVATAIDGHRGARGWTKSGGCTG